MALTRLGKKRKIMQRKAGVEIGNNVGPVSYGGGIDSDSSGVAQMKISPNRLPCLV